MNDTPTRGQRERLASIHRFDQLVAYLRDELDWPISRDSFEDVDDLFYEFTPDELGIDARNAAKIESIKRLRPLSADQPWGIFFVKFEPRRLPVVALRRLLGAVALKKRASANPADRQAWAADDLLFVSNYGEDEERRISFAHFTPGERAADLPTLKVLGWDGQDTALHLDQVANTLHRHLIWPEEGGDLEEWRSRWRSAFRLRHREAITASKELSVRLAQLARDIRDRIGTVLTVESKRGPLRKLLEAFQQTLVADLDEKGFADMYAQTIAYGLLSARIVDPEHRTTEDFAGHMRTSPFLRELMESFIKLGGRKRTEGGAGLDFDELGVSEVVELLDDANMEAVVADFGRRKQGEDPVIHFYEDFLTEYDKQEKVSRGVFYTPRPVVSYIVRSVDELLRTEFGLVDGLADTSTWGEMAERYPDLEVPEGTSPDQAFVQILDPATGTGTFLVEVIEVVHATMMDKWKGEGVRSEKALTERWNEYVPQHLLPRLHGYELMMAPYAIAHLKIGLKLYETGYRFESEERARIYLTNALEPAQDHSGKFEFAIPALANEAEAVNGIKESQRFTVLVGNPPYSASISEPAWLMELLKNWKKGLSEKKIDLNREEWKFLRFAQHHAEVTGYSVVGFITNRDYLDGIVKRRMRESLGETFQRRRVIDLNGDVKGDISDENVFDIEQGVAISLLSRGDFCGWFSYCSLVGSRKYKYDALVNVFDINAALVEMDVITPYFRWVAMPPNADNRSAKVYNNWFSIKEVFSCFSSGIQTKRDFLCVSIARDRMWQRVNAINELESEEARAIFGIPKDGRDWTVSAAKRDVAESGPSEQFVCELLYRPFDVRYTYWTGRTKGFLAYPRREVMQHVVGKHNVGLIFNRQIVGDDVSHFAVSNIPICHGTFYLGNKGQDYFAPLYVFEDSILGSGQQKRSNFSSLFQQKFCEALGINVDAFESIQAFNYLYAIFHSPQYRATYRHLIKVDFARVPLVSCASLFVSLVRLGDTLVRLHLMQDLSPSQFMTEFSGEPGCEVESVNYSNETVWLDQAATVGFKGVPENVWDFRIGGYQVCQKWLKDRQAKGGKNPRPGRILTEEDIAHYQKIIVAISETIRIMGEIDEVIEEHGGWPGAFQVDDDEQDAVPLRQAAEEKGKYEAED